ncbi:GntR family transcriptional regulator [Pseudomonas oryzihabitans]|uniref:GntR family transcriptional regulator n=1 Tax=Pseudomonas oryzihabitans TaxID=47885 RepID=A0A2Z5AAA6_9PSED|nr:GntR family transcriptional regulator [Pseudomonas oryzihabitans]AXA66836.1 GntR family transcriptional regulator [Pseudomonas oryzihabitans]
MAPKDADSTVAARRHGGRYIYEELRRQILTLQLRPGMPLDETSLATQFGLSRSPVRDALARLASEGLVTILPNRTLLVTPFEIEEFPNYISALDLLQRAVTRLAALRRSEDELQQIKLTDQKYLRAVEDRDYEQMSELNKAFHLQIAKAGKNPYLTNSYERLLGEGQRLLHLHFDYIINSENSIRLGRDHDRIIAAIVNRDAKEAEDAAHEHTMLFQRRFLDFMQQNLTAKIHTRVE